MTIPILTRFQTTRITQRKRVAGTPFFTARGTTSTKDLAYNATRTTGNNKPACVRDPLFTVKGTTETYINAGAFHSRSRYRKTSRRFPGIRKPSGHSPRSKDVRSLSYRDIRHLAIFHTLFVFLGPVLVRNPEPSTNPGTLVSSGNRSVQVNIDVG